MCTDTALRRRSGRPTRIRSRTPVLFVLKVDDDGENFSIDYTNADELRLWTMSRIRRIYAAREESDENLLAWGVYRTNFEGLLVKRRQLAGFEQDANRPRAAPKKSQLCHAACRHWRKWRDGRRFPGGRPVAVFESAGVLPRVRVGRGQHSAGALPVPEA